MAWCVARRAGEVVMFTYNVLYNALDYMGIHMTDSPAPVARMLHEQAILPRACSPGATYQSLPRDLSCVVKCHKRLSDCVVCGYRRGGGAGAAGRGCHSRGTRHHRPRCVQDQRQGAQF
jgi:hypothetical protein